MCVILAVTSVFKCFSRIQCWNRVVTWYNYILLSCSVSQHSLFTKVIISIVVSTIYSWGGEEGGGAS